MGRDKKPRLEVPCPPKIPDMPSDYNEIPQWMLMVVGSTTIYLNNLKNLIATSSEDDNTSHAEKVWNGVRNDLNALSRAAGSAQKILDLAKDKERFTKIFQVIEDGCEGRGIDISSAEEEK